MRTTSGVCTRPSSRAASPTSHKSPPTTSTARTWASATPSATPSGSSSRGRSPRRRRPEHGRDENRKEGRDEVSQEHHRDEEEVQGIHGRGKSRDDGPRPRAEDRRAPGGRGKRPARKDRRAAGTGSRHGQAAP